MATQSLNVLLNRLSWLLVLLLVGINSLLAGVTGKIKGVVVDEGTNDPLPGANIIVEGSHLGASTDVDGTYFIINLPPGNYSVVCSMMGYSTFKKTEVYVAADKTTSLNFKMKEQAIAGEEVIVTAERALIDKDISSSEMLMREEDVEAFSQDAFQDFLSTQVGVDYTATSDGSGISIRGGGIDQTNVYVNDVSLRNAITQQPSLGLSLTSIREVNIQTGGFSAEYGDIRSGLVNVISKEGARDHFSMAVDARYAPAQKKHFGPNPYSVNGPIWNVYCGPKAFEGVTEEDVASGEYAFGFLGWNKWAEQNLNDDDPNNDYTPQQWMEIWRWQHRNIAYANKPDYIIDASLDGPIPLGNTTFLLSQHYENLQLAFPYSRNNSILSTSQANFTIRISPAIKLTFTNLFTLQRGVVTQEVDYSYGMIDGTPEGSVLARNVRWHMLYNPYGINPTERKTFFSGLKLNHALSPRTYYSISLNASYFTTHTGIEDYRDPEKTVMVGNVELDYTPIGFKFSTDQYDMFDQFWISGGGGQIDDSKYWQLRLKGLFESQINYHNLLKLGFETAFTQYDMRAAKVHVDQLMEDNYYPSDFITGAVPMDTYFFDKHPLQFSAFIQDKLEYEGMVANLGLRFDLFDPMMSAWDVSNWNTYYNFDNWRTDVGFVEARTGGGSALKSKVSPRVGISYPATETSKFYFNYGHFYQLPLPEGLFNINLSSGSPPFFIPNLEAEWPKTVSYEVGFEKALTNAILFRISGYYKDVTYQITNQGWYDFQKNLLYDTDANNSYEDIRGLEIRFQQRQGRFGYGWIDFEYMSTSEGLTGFAQVHQNPQYEQEQRENAVQEKNWPVPRVNVVYSFRLPRNFGPEVWVFRPLSDWTLQINAYWRDGGKRIFDSSAPVWDRHYIDQIDRHNVNLLIKKRFVMRDFDISLYARVRNLTNFKGPVYPYSGEEYRNSLRVPWLEGARKGNDKYGEGPSSEKPWIRAGWQTWRQYMNPRHVMFGVEIDFKVF
jgi:outer membrane receptor protein involved in Fe transport